MTEVDEDGDDGEDGEDSEGSDGSSDDEDEHDDDDDDDDDEHDEDDDDDGGGGRGGTGGRGGRGGRVVGVVGVVVVLRVVVVVADLSCHSHLLPTPRGLFQFLLLPGQLLVQSLALGCQLLTEVFLLLLAQLTLLCCLCVVSGSDEQSRAISACFGLRLFGGSTLRALTLSILGEVHVLLVVTGTALPTRPSEELLFGQLFAPRFQKPKRPSSP